MHITADDMLTHVVFELLPGDTVTIEVERDGALVVDDAVAITTDTTLSLVEDEFEEV